jgi:protein-disulfide isomerase
MTIMMKTAALILVTLALSIGTAQAACPAPAPGNTAGEIQANGERIVCLQNELAAESRQRSLQFQIDALQKTQQDIIVQRRLDALPAIPVYVPPPPVIVVPGS